MIRLVVSKAPFVRIVRVGNREITFEPGANLVDDDVLAIPAVVRLLERGMLRERPLPSADQEFTGELPDDITTLTEAGALRAIAAVHVSDAQRLRNWRDSEPRPRIRAAIDRALTHLHLAQPGNLLRD